MGKAGGRYENGPRRGPFGDRMVQTPPRTRRSPKLRPSQAVLLSPFDLGARWRVW